MSLVLSDQGDILGWIFKICIVTSQAVFIPIHNTAVKKSTYFLE